MMKSDKRYSISTGLAIIFIVLSGCTKDDEAHMKSSSIGFSASIASMYEESETKSGRTDFELTDESRQIVVPLTCEVLDNLPGQTLTKGTLVNDNIGGANIALPAAYSPFHAYAYNSSGAAFFTSATGNLESVTLSGSQWTAGHTYSWPEGSSLTFYAYANMPASTVASVSATKDGETLTYSSLPSSAADQKDILLGYYSGAGGKDETSKTISAGIVFQHPLTAVRFKLGDWGEGRTIKSISIKGVASSGSVTLTNDGKISAWTVSDYTKTVSTSSTEATGFSVNKGDYIGDTFIIIPQNMTDHPVTVRVDPVSGPALTAVLDGGSLTQGKVNEFTIGFDAYNYVLEVLSGTDITFNDIGSNGKQDITVKSHKYIKPDQSDAKAVFFKVDYSTDNGATWSSFNPNNTSGSTIIANLYGSFSDKNYGSLSGNQARNIALYSKSKERINNPDFKYGWEDKGFLGSSSNRINLAKRDANGDEIPDGLEHSANCYVIHQAGYYKLPLVYGNSLQGSSSANGYTSTAAYSGTPDRILSPFVNCNGTAINDKYILSDLHLSSNDVGAKLIWQDAWENGEGMITEVGIDGQYLTFKTASGANLVEGNAVLAVYQKSNNKILWSWHIWASCLGFKDSDCQSNVQDAVFGPSLLGWCEGRAIRYRVPEEYHTVLLRLTQTEGSAAPVVITVHQPDVDLFLQGNCTFYDAGRKDPVLGYDFENNANKSWYSIDSGTANNNIIYQIVSSVPLGTADTPASAKSAISREIQNPQTLYITKVDGQTGRVPFYLNLWSLNCNRADTGGASIPTVKTIYDPCPYGFKIPNHTQFSSFGSKVAVNTPYVKYKYGNVVCEIAYSRNAGSEYALNPQATFSSYCLSTMMDSTPGFTLFNVNWGYVFNAHYMNNTCNCYPVFPVRDN